MTTTTTAVSAGKKIDITPSLPSLTSSQNNTNNTRDKKTHKNNGQKLKFLLDGTTTVDLLHNKAISKVACTPHKCLGSTLDVNIANRSSKTLEEKIIEATDFLAQFYASVKHENSKAHKERLEEVLAAIRKNGTYELKETELSFGAQTAWRNAPRCIGRIQWSHLQVFDARHVTTARGMFEAICNHLKYSTNKGNIRSAITVFRQRHEPGHDFRVWNGQLINYAGFRIDENRVLGDRNQIEFTQVCMKLGWKPKFKEFEVLPLVLQANGQDPELFEYPPDIVMEVPLVHPKYEWFRELNMKWFCVPAVSSMLLDVGGIEFTACPFNGWYMGTEIGRDLADSNRFDKLAIIGEKLGLDMNSNLSLWKDKTLVEINYAVLHSFQKKNVTITDHHTASETFMKHYENESRLRGGCPADWVWIVPPLSSHLSPTFHLEMAHYVLKPSYEYQKPVWRTHVWTQLTTENRVKNSSNFSDIARVVKFAVKLMIKVMAKRVKCTILYATETGRSERFAKNLCKIFQHAFNARVLCMQDYDVTDLQNETLLLIVTSTFGNGDSPENGEEFKKILCQMRKEKALLNSGDHLALVKHNNNNQSNFFNSDALSNVRFSVFGLGNSSYPKFCSFAKIVDACLSELCAERIAELGLGDELSGQEESFRRWCAIVFKSAVKAYSIDYTDKEFSDLLSKDQEHLWSSQTVRLTPVETSNKKNKSSNSNKELCATLSKMHSRRVLPCKLKNRVRLHDDAKSGRATIRCDLSTQGHQSEMEYEPGDHLGILASNRSDLVNAVLKKINNAPPPDQLSKIEILKEKTISSDVTTEWVVDERFPHFTLRLAFTNLLDITSPPTQKLLMYLSSQTSDEKDRVKLEKLAKDDIFYNDWKLRGWPNLVEVLDEFPSVRPNASLLITQLPKLQPRFYSISSSPKFTTADDIQLTIGVVVYKPIGKAVHHGVCTNWLKDLNLGQMVPTFVRRAPNFRMPDDPTCPIMMIGAGTGIAPFRSFWQERKIDMKMNRVPTGVNGQGWGKLILYFGCRHKNIDELYKSEIKSLVKEGVISKYIPAYSRDDTSKKYYVQDALSKKSDEVNDLIFNRNCHVYVCGDLRMAVEVTHSLERALSKHSKMSLEEAKIYVNEMKENLRFHEDIFGNSANLTPSEIN